MQAKQDASPKHGARDSLAIDSTVEPDWSLLNDKKLIIMRGAPGSGKTSTVLDLLIPLFTDPKICSADFYFYHRDGTYRWVAEQLPRAHQFCFDTFLAYVRLNSSTIIIDNTNIKNRDYKQYIDAAATHGYQIFQYHPSCSEPLDNIHDVPKHHVNQMIARFENNASIPHFHLPADLPFAVQVRSKEEMHRHSFSLATAAREFLKSTRIEKAIPRSSGTKAASAGLSQSNRQFNHREYKQSSATGTGLSIFPPESISSTPLTTSRKQKAYKGPAA